MNTVKTITGFVILAIALFISWSVWESDLSGAYAQADVKEQPPPPCTCWCEAQGPIQGPICSKEECERRCGPSAPPPTTTPVPTPQQTTTPPPETQPEMQRISPTEPKTKIIPDTSQPGGLLLQETPGVDILKQMEQIKDLGTTIQAACDCECTDVSFPEKGRSFDNGNGEVDMSIRGKIKTEGEGEREPEIKAKHYFSVSTDGGKTWESPLDGEGKPKTEEKTIKLGEVKCPNDKDFEMPFSVPVGGIGVIAGSTAFYELHLYVYSPNCEMKPVKGFLKFEVSYNMAGAVASSNLYTVEFDYFENKKEKGKWRSRTSGFGWDEGGGSLPPPKK